MNFLFVVALLIIGATAQDFGSTKPQDYGAGRGGPHGAGRPPHGGGRPVGPPHGPRGDNVLLWGKPLNPNNTSSLKFITVYRADNVTLQNVNTTLPMKEGESIFLLPHPRGPPPKDGRKPPPQGLMSYVKILYNSNSTTPLSFEYGVTQLLQSLMAESESDEDTLQ